MKLRSNESFGLRNEDEKTNQGSALIYRHREMGIRSLNDAVCSFELLSPCAMSRVIFTGCYFAAENPLQLKKSVGTYASTFLLHFVYT